MFGAMMKVDCSSIERPKIPRQHRAALRRQPAGLLQIPDPIWDCSITKGRSPEIREAKIRK